MKTMTFSRLIFFICITLVAAGCSGPAGNLGWNQIAPSATPIILARPNLTSPFKPMTNACTLVTRQDIGGFYSAEVEEPLYASNHTRQVIFPAPPVSALEYYCVYLAYHLPSSISGTYYQTTYWVDTPDGASSSEWAQIWTAGKSHATQSVPDVGDEAFYVDGRLTFKKGTTYVTVEVISTRIDTNTAEGVSEQLDIEKKVALTALSHMGN